jgi:hypothetical protein
MNSRGIGIQLSMPGDELVSTVIDDVGHTELLVPRDCLFDIRRTCNGNTPDILGASRKKLRKDVLELVGEHF